MIKEITGSYSGSVRNLGRQLALGIVDVLVVVALIMYVAGLIFNVVKPTDDCDSGRFDRCNMKVLVDAKTGTEYLVTSGGGIIERRKQ